MAALGPAAAPVDPLDRLLVYAGEWQVRATHPWSGAPAGAIDRLSSRCTRYRAYVACEQTVNGKPLSLIVVTAGDRPDTFWTRTIAPNGLAGGRGTLTMAGERWTWLDKPAAGLTGPWSRTDNVIARDRITFAEYQSTDEGRTWTPTNSGSEERVRGRG